MTHKPSKPIHYTRDSLLLALIAFVLFAVLTYYEQRYFVVLVPLWFFIIASQYWFRDYNRQVRQYKEHLADKKRQEREFNRLEKIQGSSVNKNIERYLKQQREKKALAPWWKFWV